MPVAWATGDLTLVSPGGISATPVDLDSVLVDGHPLKEKTAGRMTQQKTVFSPLCHCCLPSEQAKTNTAISLFVEFPN